MSALFRRTAAAVIAGSAIAAHTGSAQSPDRPRTRFQEMSFVLPPGEWKREKGSPAELQVIFNRASAPGHAQTLSVSRVDYGVERYALSRIEHTTLVFDLEQKKPRTIGSWSGWNRSEHAVGSLAFPTMTYRVAFPNGSQPSTIADATFAIYFPPDFASREQFYILNWIDTHPAGETPAGLSELDSVLTSFTVEPRKSSPAIVTYSVTASQSKAFAASLVAFHDAGFPASAADTTLRAVTSGVVVLGPRQKLGDLPIGNIVNCGKELGISHTSKGQTMLVLTEAVRASGDSAHILLQLLSGNHDETTVFGQSDRECTSKGKLEKLVYDRIVAHLTDG